MNKENPAPKVINNLQFFFADPWNPTANGEFRRVSVITPDCVASAPDDVIEHYLKHEIRVKNTIMYAKKYGERSRMEADEFCSEKGQVKRYDS